MKSFIGDNTKKLTNKYSVAGDKVYSLDWRVQIIISLALFTSLVFPPGIAEAQDEIPPGPIYIVQEGDTLWEISQRFSITVQDLSRYNRIGESGHITPGMPLVIPGMEDVEGVLVTAGVPYGETARSLSLRYGIPIEALSRLNRLVTPTSLYAGSIAIIPERSAALVATKRVNLAPGQSLLELSVVNNTNLWSLIEGNQLGGSWHVVPGDVLRVPGGEEDDGPGGLPAAIRAIDVYPIPLVQGGTMVVHLMTTSELNVEGSLIDRDTRFFPIENRAYTSLQGVHAMTRPGFYPLELAGTLEDGTLFQFSQLVYVRDGGYRYETLIVPPETLDPANTEPEDELWYSAVVEATNEKLWDGLFQAPVASHFADCFTSFYGNRRSYNGSPFNYFHTGLDFCGVSGEIYTPAPGVVVLAEDLIVRGKSTIIDHGWGIYTGYMHQSEILVEVGERVETGQVIGMIGATGRVTGAHLHWEVFAGQIQVNPMDWLERIYP